MLSTSPANVIIRNFDGSGHYGRSNGGSTGAEEEAVIISQAVGKPIRLQWMRWDDMQWSTQHSPSYGDVQGRDRRQRQARRLHRQPLHERRAGRPAGRSAARRLADDGAAGKHDSSAGELHPVHELEHVRHVGLSDASERARAGVRNLQPRDDSDAAELRPADRAACPQHADAGADGSRTSFARRSSTSWRRPPEWIPFQFRLNNTNDPRMISVINAVKEASSWETRPSPSKTAATTGSKALDRAGL